MIHDRGWVRSKGWHKAIRKRTLDQQKNRDSEKPEYDNLHQYSKNKVESIKIRRTRATYPKKSLRDQRNLIEENEQIEELDI